jgi:hypothetical protein
MRWSAHNAVIYTPPCTQAIHPLVAPSRLALGMKLDTEPLMATAYRVIWATCSSSCCSPCAVTAPHG